MKLGGTLYHDLRAMLETEELPSLGPEPRGNTLSTSEIDARLKPAVENAHVSPAVVKLLRGAVYLWHDHLDAAHGIAQEIETSDGCILHAILHRREPDYGNAKYWFRRASTHPSFLALAARAGDYLEKADETDLQTRLVPNRTWDPFAFVDAVEDAQSGKFPSKVAALQQVQKLEMDCFLENLVNRLGS